MTHEYIEDLTQLVDAVQIAFEGIEMMESFAENLIKDFVQRFELIEN